MRWPRTDGTDRQSGQVEPALSPARRRSVAPGRDCGVDIRERAQNERAFMHSRMRHDEARGTNAPATEQQEVDVERPRRVAPGASAELSSLGTKPR